jgi:signal transduction histidine kinase
VKSFKPSIKTVFLTITALSLLLILSVALMLSTQSKTRLILDESKQLFDQSATTAQIILDNELQKLASVVGAKSFSLKEIKLLTDASEHEIKEFLSITIPSGLSFNAFMSHTSDAPVLSGLFLYDTTVLQNYFKRTKASALQKDFVTAQIGEKTHLYFIVSKAVIDENGKVAGIYFGGLEISDNVRLFQEIKEKTKMEYLELSYGDLPILGEGTGKDLHLKAFNKPLFLGKNTVFYKTALTFDTKPSNIVLKMGLLSRSLGVAQNMLYKDLGIITALALVIIVAFVWFINIVFIRPIEKLKINAKEFLQSPQSKSKPLELYLKEYQELGNYLFGLFSKLLYNQQKLEKANAKIDRDLQLIKELNDTLEQKVEEKTSQLTRQMQQMQQKDKMLQEQAKLASMGEMIDAVAHQWKTPLTSISFFAQDLEYVLKEKGTYSDEAKEDIEGILGKVDHLVDTINSFREFFRPVSVIRPESLQSLIRSTLLLMQDELLKNNITTTIEGDDCEIYLIPNEFKQVLISLINNSKDAFVQNHMQVRNIRFTIKQPRPNAVKLLIEDTAGGIPESIISNIFEPHVTTKQDRGGTGIGLYIVKLILDKIGAQISVTNTGGGASFAITIFNACEINTDTL